MEKAIFWLKEIDGQGDPSGAAQLGYLYEHGSGIPQNYAEAAKWYARAANLGDGASQWALGEFYEKGFGVKEDIAEAKKWYAAAATQGFGGAKRDLERLSGKGTDGGATQSLQLEDKLQALRKLSGDLAEIGLMTDLQAGRCARASEVKSKAFHGNVDSIYLLSDMYKNGWCVGQDLDRFHMYLEDAAKKGELSAAFDLGFYYEEGSVGYLTNYKTAEYWYRRAIDRGEERAMVQLGDMLIKGKGKKDAAQGLRLLEKGAASGLPDVSNRALGLLAAAYLPGGALPQNTVTARNYALRAAARCDPVGMLAVSVSYEQPTTLVQAYAWANAAAQHSDEKQQQVAIETRDALEKRLDTASITRAQSLTDSLPVCLGSGPAATGSHRPSQQPHSAVTPTSTPRPSSSTADPLLSDIDQALSRPAVSGAKKGK